MEEPRTRKTIPPQSDRDWLSIEEAAEAIGCSKSTAHRLRRGEISGVPRLPSVQVARRKWVIMKSSLQEWQRRNERSSAA